MDAGCSKKKTKKKKQNKKEEGPTENEQNRRVRGSPVDQTKKLKLKRLPVWSTHQLLNALHRSLDAVPYVALFISVMPSKITESTAGTHHQRTSIMKANPSQTKDT